MRDISGKFTKGNLPPQHKTNCNCFRCATEQKKLQGKYIPCNYCKKLVYREINELKRYKKFYCSNSCRFPKVYNICLICNNNYRIKPSHASKRTTCGSQECESAYRKILPGYWKGKKRSDISGEKNWRWKNGITPLRIALRNSMEYEEWRKRVFERDLYTCQECGAVGEYLHADHIKPFSLYPELRFDASNGKTLCVPCHYKKTWNRIIPKNSKWGHRKYRKRGDLI